MSVYSQSYLKPAYSGVGAPASPFASPAPSEGGYFQHEGAPSSARPSPAGQQPLQGQHTGAASSPLPYGSGAPASTYAPSSGPPGPMASQPSNVPPPYTHTPPPTVAQHAQPASNDHVAVAAYEEAVQVVPQKTTFPPHKDEKHSYPQVPDMAYQAPQPMSEKPQTDVMNHQHHGHVPQNELNPRGSWTFGLFDCFSPLSTCCMATWCPCFLYGRTYNREHGDGETCGAGLMCCVWYCAAYWGLYGCLQCVSRRSQRQRHGIESNACNDFVLSCCCTCCTLVQEEKESLVRVAAMDPTTNVKYQPVNQGMHYPA